MKKIKRAFKILFIFTLILSCLVCVSSITFFNFTTKGISLDTEKLQILDPTQALAVFDSNKNTIKPSTVSYVKLSKLSSDTKNAFICAEDKRFYKHHGVDLIRIGGAILSNIKSGSFSEGASTISQQLVKNTQLTNEKTISRKLKEIKLTKELEQQYSKDEILELYLNKIYFGNGCYGIENASKHYFNKPASNLTLAESSLLAGSINAPSVYDIENNPSQAQERRDLILSLMKNQGKISEDDYVKAKTEKIKLNLTETSGQSALYKNIITEAANLLNISEFTLQNSNYKIFTSIDSNLNKQLSSISKNYTGEFDKAIIVIDNKTHQIIASLGKSQILNHEWQPGSLIKPILVYAPAIEKEIISPSTKILDEQINISGYAPENADKQFHGFVSSKTALSNSYNIPAVKLLNELGIDYAKKFSEELGISFSDSDNHLALALGGFEKGITPKSICDAYSTFACNGKFQQSSYISKITKNGKLVYKNKLSEKQVMKESTSKMINEMLLECSQTGTGKRLKDLPFSVCTKTGTVGKPNSNYNTLAYNVCYTTEHTILTLFQNDNLPANINGATYPTMLNKDILMSLYKKHTPADFKLQLSSDNEFLEQQKNISKKTSSKSFNNDLDKHYLYNKNTLLTAINSPHHKPIICFTINKNCDYFLIRAQKKEEEIIFSSSQNNENFVKFIDKTAKNNEIYTYKLKICDKLKNTEFFSNEIKLRTYQS